MAAILGEHYLRCGICQKKIYASDAKKHYLGFWTCRDDYEETPIALLPLPKPREMTPLPAWKVNKQSTMVSSTPYETWDTIEQEWDLVASHWNNT